jgi:hypothetical protein
MKKGNAYLRLFRKKQPYSIERYLGGVVGVPFCIESERVLI